MAKPPAGEGSVYVKVTKIVLGTGSTSRNSSTQTYFRVYEGEGDKLRCVLLNDKRKETGLVDMVPEGEFLAEYQSAPDYRLELTEEETDPQKVAARKQVAAGKVHLEKEEFLSAEFEFDKAIRLDDRNVEAKVGKGASLVGQGDVDGAKEVFAQVSEMEELYEDKNKHVMNDYGMRLRQGKFYDQALATYRRALDLDPEDENLRYNIARAYYEQGALDQCLAEIEQTLKLRPGHADAETLKKLVEAKKAGA